MYFHDYATSTFSSVLGFYPMLSQGKMKIELHYSLFYSRRDLTITQDALNIFSWVFQNDFSESMKMLKIIGIIPIPIAESERCLLF